METKKCSKCGEVKTLNNFTKDSRYDKGVKGICKDCTKKGNVERYHKNPEKYRTKNNAYVARTPHLTEQRRIRTYIKFLEGRGFSVTKE